MRVLPLAFIVVACKDDPRAAGDGQTDSADTADTGDPLPEPAALAPLSSGQCPDLSVPGTSSFLSSDVERTATVLFPDDAPADMPVVFFFHGLMSPDQTPEPTAYMAEALDLQALAEETKSVIVLPESRVQEMLGYTFYLWEVAEQDELDLVLFDDLRTCVADVFDPDLRRLSAMGLSGGALFMTVVMRERGDTLASAIEMSGGSDVEVPVFDNPLAAYGTPAYAMPALLATGGENDVWPDPSFVVVDFTAATDTLQEKLLADGHYVVRCEHSRGHTVTPPEFTAAKDWALAHTFGLPSPYAEEGIGDLAEWCYVGNAG